MKFGGQTGAGTQIVLLNIDAQPAIEQGGFANAELANQWHLQMKTVDGPTHVINIAGEACGQDFFANQVVEHFELVKPAILKAA